MRRLLPLLALAAGQVLAGAETAGLPAGLYAEFTTPRGKFTAQLLYQQTPMTCMSFVGLAEGGLAARDGKPFYTRLRWDRVVPDFVIQSGDPTNPGGGIQDRPKPTPADETAGHPYSFPDEMVPGLHHDSAGVLSMANGGPDTNSSEFFITLGETNRLNYLHSVFGRVVRGLDVLPQVKQDDAFSIRIVRVGAAAQAFRPDEATFAALVAAAKKYAGPAEPGAAAYFDDPDKLLPQDVPRAQNFNFQLANFERFTGHRIYARVFRKFTPENPGQKLSQFNAGLARRFGIEPEGVMVSYYADVDTWMIWIGEKWLARFMGRAGSREEFVETGELMKRKEAFLAEARQRATAVAARARAAGREVDHAEMLKLTVDEVLDALILLYEPKTTP
jgi:cyclophilin family peptidyl-prolyl cis-trans isomerase